MTSGRFACKLISVSNWLEAEVRAAARHLHAKQIARIYQIPDDLMSQRRTPADFFGYTSTARAILIECKICAKPSLPMIANGSGLQPHQRKALNELERANGVALLAWGKGGNGVVKRVALLDPLMIEKMSEGRRSVPWTSIPPTHVFYVHELAQALELMLTPGAVSRARLQ